MKKEFLLAAVMVMAFTPFAFGDPGDHGPGGPPDGQDMGGPEMMMERGFNNALEELKLTEEQQQKLHDIRDSSKRDIFNLRHEIQLSIMDIQDEYKKEKSDASRINASIDKLAADQKKLMRIRSDQMLKMKDVLTPDQFKKLMKKIDKARNNAKKGFLDKLFKK